MKKVVKDTHQNKYDFVCQIPCSQYVVNIVLKSNEICNKKREGGTYPVDTIIEVE